MTELLVERVNGTERVGELLASLETDGSLKLLVGHLLVHDYSAGNVDDLDKAKALAVPFEEGSLDLHVLISV